jgi:hypothetical protein
MDERTTLARRARAVLERLAATLEEIPEDRIDVAPFEGASSPAQIAAHVRGAARGWILGIGCGLDVPRDRVAEFATAGVPRGELAAGIRSLADEVDEALGGLSAAALGQSTTPPQALLGLMPAQEVVRRDAILMAIAHAAEHLGELQITRDLAKRA